MFNDTFELALINTALNGHLSVTATFALALVMKGHSLKTISSTNRITGISGWVVVNDTFYCQIFLWQYQPVVH